MSKTSSIGLKPYLQAILYPRQIRNKIAVVLGLVILFIVSFELLFNLVGPVYAALIVIPVAAAGWYFGSVLGILFGLFGVLISTLLLVKAGGGGFLQWMAVGWPGNATVLIIGFAAGLYRKAVMEQDKARINLNTRDRFIILISLAVKKAIESSYSGDFHYHILTHMTNLLVADYAHLFRWDELNQNITLVSSTKSLEQPFSNIILIERGSSLLIDVLNTGHVKIINDVENSDYVINPGFLGAILSPPQTAICIPLIVGNYKYGVVAIAYETAHTFTHEELLYTELAGSLIALSVWTFEQDRKIKDKLNELNLLTEIGRALSSSEKVGINKILQLIVDSAINLIPPSKHAVLHLLDNDKQMLVPSAVAGYTGEIKSNLNMRLGEGVAGQVISSGKVISISDIMADSRFVNQTIPANFRSLVVTPIQGHNHPIGTISIYSDVKGAFTSDEVNLLNALSIQAAIAYENANLLEQLRQEIVERKDAESKVVLQATALNSAVNGIMIMNVDQKVLWVNPALENMTGYSRDELLGSHPFFLKTIPHEPYYVNELWRSIRAGKPWYGELINVRKDGSEFTAEMTFTPVLDHQNNTITHFISIFQDISERIKARDELKYLATHDNLTGLPNRLLLSDRLSHALALAKRNNHQGAILFIDLDDFKSVNDAFSHEVGDELLVFLANQLKSCLRESDTVARIGGDEFAILLENVDQYNLDRLARKISNVISTSTTIQENLIISTASIGISMFPQDGDTISDLMKNADLAMYQSKEKGKNNFRYYNHEMTVRVEKQMELVTYLRRALSENIFELYYQPQVDIKEGKIVGMEALLRLRNSHGDWIHPEEFIGLAEKSGLIIDIDAWVLNAACKRARELLDLGTAPIKISVNLSNRQIGQPNLISLLSEMIKKYKLDPSNIEIEISESSLMQDLEKTIKTLEGLKKLGVKLAIDDFGKGFSSLNYLSHFPLDTLKIDMSFTHKVPTSQTASAIVAGIISIANNLRLAIVVEGVENQEQLEFFERQGCRYVQGFLLYRPISSDKVINALTDSAYSAGRYQDRSTLVGSEGRT